MRQTFGGLDSLLRTLRAAGIAVGSPELDRLRWVFAQAPALDARQLRQLLRCTLAKSPEQARLCDDLIRAWIGDADAVLREPGQPTFDDRPFVLPRPEPQSLARRWWRLGAMALAAGIALTLTLWRLDTTTAPKASNTDPPLPRPDRIQPTSESSKIDLPKDPVPKFLRWVGAIDESRTTHATGQQPVPAWLLLWSTFASLATAGWVLHAHLRADRPAAVPPLRSGPSHAPPPHPPTIDRALLSAAEARLAVAGVDSFAGEEPSHRLDLPCTVEATAAAGGIVTFVHERPRQPREVWLWRDHTTANPTAALLVGDFATVLQRAGHQVQVGALYGDMTEVTLVEGHSVAPLALEAHRQQALVGIFTDGAELERRLGSATEGPAQEQVLQALARWPRLALVDCGAPGSYLPAIGRRFGIPCLNVGEATEFVGLHHRRHRDDTPSDGALRGALAVWAQVLVLLPRPFSEADALDAHRCLGLEVPRHDLPHLLGHAGAEGLGFTFEGDTAAKLRHWLALPALHNAVGDEGSDTLLHRAADYWLERIAHDDARRTHEQTAMQPWTDTEAQARLQLNRACVQLWVDPVAASAALDRLARRARRDAPPGTNAPLAAEIRRRLARCRSDARPEPPPAGDRQVRLPWRWHNLPARTQLQLWRLGFAEGSWRLAAKVRPANRTLLALGLCLGVLAAPLLAFLLPTQQEHLAAPRFLDAPPLPGLIQHATNREASVLLGEPANVVRVGSPRQPGEVLAVTWRTEPGENTSTVWDRGTTDVLRPRPAGWPLSSIAVIQASSGEVDARQLAIRLLDSGTADRVVFHPGEGWEERLRLDYTVWMQGLLFRREPSTRDVFRPLVLGGDGNAFAVAWHRDFAELARELDRMGLASEIWAGHCEAVGNVRVRSLSMQWVPAGSFAMGSQQSPQGRDSYESPQHRVTVPAFWLWPTEFSRADYRAVMPAGAVPAEWIEKDDGSMPANYIDFPKAALCCNALSRRAGLDEYYIVDGDRVEARGGLGYRLPSEAEWEYACRAGTTTRFWSGDRDEDLARVGWYAGNSGGKLNPVAQKPANAFGLHDMHGNVWEWCEDAWHSSYEGAPSDGRVWTDSASGSRVDRGGGFGASADLARSACRGHVEPWRRSAILGFRPARSVAPR